MIHSYNFKKRYKIPQDLTNRIIASYNVLMVLNCCNKKCLMLIRANCNRQLCVCVCVCVCVCHVTLPCCVGRGGAELRLFATAN